MKKNHLNNFIVLFQNVFSQENKDCDEWLLSKEFIIDYDSFEEKIYEPIDSFSFFINCGLVSN